MSIRVRLVLLSFVIALLPAVPLSFLVKALLEKSFNVGLSATMEEALQSGLVVSRQHLEQLRLAFEDDVERLVTAVINDGGLGREGKAIESRLADTPGIDGFVLLTPSRQPVQPASGLPAVLARYAGDDVLAELIDDATPVIERAPLGAHTHDQVLLESQDRSLQLALWGGVLFYARTDPAFLDAANRLIAGRQIFAELRLTQPTLSRSFFYPFVIIYSVIVAVSLALALFMSERLANPIRRLVRGTNIVAGGDWNYRLDVHAGGEVGRLVEAFNGMVSRLDDQQRRLVDMQKMATWREMARHLAHEIKNPLLPIRLTVQELSDQYDGDDARYRRILEDSTRVIADELDHLKNLVKEFSSFARLPEIKPRHGAIEPLLRDVAALYPQVTTDVASDASVPQFPFDPEQMRGVIVNLFDNAVSVSSGNPAVVIVIKRMGDNVMMMFADNGPGIAAENLETVFDPYFTTRSDGTGLGLAMVKNVILLHGGTIRAENGKNGGAMFVITLPLAGPGGSASSTKEP
jgi:nitrogen fixation/metabolism regulation signal transduction histidine kinase